MEKRYHHSLRDHAYDWALKKYPVRWFENLRVRLLISILLVYPLTWLQVQIGIPPKELWISLLGIVIAFVACAADGYTTYLALKFKPEFDRRGMEFPTYEHNPLLPRFPTGREFIFNRLSLLIIPMGIAIFFVPLACVFALVIEGAETVSHLLTIKRLKLALRIADRGKVEFDGNVVLL